MKRVRNNALMAITETVRRNVIARMENVAQKLVNVSAPWDGKVNGLQYNINVVI